jgi:hypothetical protein
MLAIKNYDSVKDIADTLEKEISETKSSLGEYLRKLDEIRTFAEKSKRVREIVMKMSGKKTGANDSMGELEIGGLKIILDANAFHQLTAIESAVRSHQERLMVLQKASEGLKSLDQIGDTEGLNFIVLENHGVPERILLKTQ